ncbi:MAG TPA: VPAMP-CTERM sorting domain-containing protein [Chthoniobacter sp.]
MDLLPQMMFACARRMRLCLIGFLLLAGLAPARLHAQIGGQADSTFTAEISGPSVECAAVQPDGKVIIGGSFFAEVDSYPFSNFDNVARLNADGSVDASFNPGAGANSSVLCLAVQADGKVVVGGNFVTMNGRTRPYLCRLNTDGSLDTGFTPGIQGPVLGVAIQSNGQIVAVGNFSGVTGSSQTRITRLNTDGSLDATFSQSATANNQINTVAVQPNGSIVIGGSFTSVNGTAVNRIVRLTSAGVLDTTFNPGTGANAAINGLVLLTSGKLVIYGAFTAFNGTTCGGIAQLTSTGSLDTAANFSPGTGPSPAGTINSIALQTDGKLVVGGNFTSFSGSSRARLVRLSSTGALESTSTFNPPNIGNAIYSVGLQGNGDIVIGGSFYPVGTSYLVARLTNTTSAQTLTVPNSSTVTWSRINACPEVWNATFELSTNQGATWSSLGTVSRISNGWQLTGLSLPASGYVRARGQATAGSGDGGLELLEQLQGFGGATLSPVANALPATPTATTMAPGFPITYGATLNGSVNALDNSTTVTFQYGLTTAYGQSITATPSPVGGSTLTSVSAAITYLSPDTTYHYQVQAVSSAGTTYSSDATFTTFSDVDTLSSLSVNGATLSPPFDPYLLANTSFYDAVLPSTATSATINLPTTDPNATVTVNGVAIPAGTSGAVVAVSPGNNTETVVVTAQDGLTTDTYYLTVTVTTTPTAATAPADVADVYTTLKGSVAAMDTSATVTFQYGSTTSYGSTISGGNASGGFNEIVGATITGLTPGGTYHYQVTITNSQGSATSNDEVFTTYLAPPPGSIDSTFNASATFVQATATQPNGQIIVGGFFSQVDGVSASNLARLNADGTLDATFNAGTIQGQVDCIAVQPNGQILVGGYLTTIHGATVNNLVRLNADGSLDATFTPTLNASVSAIAVQTNGQIVIGGNFFTVNGTSQQYLARLNADGSLDTSFAPTVDVFVSSVVIQSNQQIMIGGWFSTVNGTATKRVARLNADGTTDTSFVTTINNPVNCLAVQANGQIVVGGWFTTVDGAACSNLTRLNTDGTRDTSFNPNVDQEVYTLALQTNGQILLGGLFQHVAATPRSYLARLNGDGTLDTIFNPDANAPVYSIAPRADGEVLIAGDFNAMFGLLHSSVALVLNDPASQFLSVPDLTQIQWARGGSAPEVSPVTFDLSTDGGNTWNSLGSGARVTGGWQLTGLSLPASGLLRARGYTSNGDDTGSSGIIEQDFAYPPTIMASTANLAENAVTLVITGTNFDPNAANDTVTLSDGAVGTVTQASATSLTVTFSIDPNSLGNLTATVTTDGQSSAAPVQVATVGPPAYTITTSGYPTADGATSGGGTFNSGDSVTVTAIPNPGCTFVNWTVNGSPVGTGASYTFNAGSNQTLVANFSAGVPAMPPWGWAVLGGALLLVAGRNLPGRRRSSTEEV